MAQSIEEDEFRHGARELTEVWETKTKVPHPASQEADHRRTKRGLEEELEEIVTGGPGETACEEGETAPKRFRSGSLPIR